MDVFAEISRIILFVCPRNLPWKELQGGGPLIGIGVHMLHTALYLIGLPSA
jgi:hypothetical protein